MRSVARAQMPTAETPTTVLAEAALAAAVETTVVPAAKVAAAASSVMQAVVASLPVAVVVTWPLRAAPSLRLLKQLHFTTSVV